MTASAWDESVPLVEWREDWETVRGCEPVSPGCAHCYGKGNAEPWRGTRGHEYAAGFDPQLRPDRLLGPLSWPPARIRTFADSDLFQPHVPDEYIAAVYAVMAAGSWHLFAVHTKRPERMAALVADPAFRDRVGGLVAEWQRRPFDAGAPAWPLPNVVAGTTIETDAYTARADALRTTPAADRFLTCSPLLGPLPSLDLAGIGWVSSHDEIRADERRPTRYDWVAELHDKALAAGIPFGFRRINEPTYEHRCAPESRTPHALPPFPAGQP